MDRVSVIIPVYNEERTIYQVIENVKAIVDPDEIIVVDDGSTDKTTEILDGMSGFVLVRHGSNQGKGKCIQDGIFWAKGDIIAICDADVEYNISDLDILIVSLKCGNDDVIYGTRYPDKWHRITANKFLTWLSNLRTGRKLTDMETCFKVFRKDALKEKLVSNGFEIEAEITRKLQGEIKEVEIRYDSRTKRQGKKIGWFDGIKTIWRIFR